MDKSLETGKLPKKFKNEWLKALRSGDYKQAQGGLKIELENRIVGYCCLGVAGEIVGCKIPIEKYGESIHAWIGGRKTRGTATTPIIGYTKVPKLLHGNEGVGQELAEMNDDGNDFKTIADYIEQNL